MSSILRLLRPHQWLKNLLVFAPLFFSGSWDDSLGYLSLLAFIAMSFLASAGYCVNDILDRDADRAHPEKSNRPLASGELSLVHAVLLSIVLAVLSLAIAFFFVNQLLMLVLLGYLLTQLIYSFFAKHHAVLDIIFLSSFYVIRLLAGVAATGIEPSTWILIFTWLAALTVAIGKRYIEIVNLDEKATQTRAVSESYSLTYLRAILSATSAATLVCYVLWCQETVQAARFRSFEILPSVFFVAFGLFRFKLLVLHERFNEDPTFGFLEDRGLVLSVLLFGVFVGAVIYA